MSRFYLRSLAHAQRVAKSLRATFPALKLSQAQEWAAELLGYRDFHELQTATRQRVQAPSALDEHVPVEVVAQRHRAQALILARLAGIPSTEAALLVAQISATGRSASTPNIAQERGGRLFDEALVAAFDGDARTAIAKIQEMMSVAPQHPVLQAGIDLIVTTLAIEGVTTDQLKPLIDQFPDHVEPVHLYNAANDALQTAASPEEHRDAMRLFEKVLANPNAAVALRSAALVNSTTAIRDGLLGDAPDWPQALERYEDAARLGNVIGKFNAGTVASWLADKPTLTSVERAQYAERAASWFRATLDHVPCKDDEGHVGAAGLRPIQRNAELRLAGLRLDQTLPTADTAEARRLLGPVMKDRSPETMHTRCQAAEKALSALRPTFEESPGELWRHALECIGWEFVAPFKTNDVRIEGGSGVLSILLDTSLARLETGGTIPIVVTHLPCFPDGDRPGEQLIGAAEIAEKRLAIRRPFLLFPGVSTHTQQDGRVFTAAYVAREDGKTVLVAVSTHTPIPDLLLEQQYIPFGSDAKYSGHKCQLPFAVNLPREGTDATPYLCEGKECPAAIFGDWYVASTNIRALQAASALGATVIPRSKPTSTPRRRGRRRKGYRSVLFLFVSPDHSTILPRVERGEIEPPRYSLHSVDFCALHDLVKQAFPIPGIQLRLANDLIDQVTVHMHLMNPRRYSLEPWADALLDVAAYSDEAMIDVRDRWATLRDVPMDPDGYPPISIIPIVAEGFDFEDTMIGINQMQRYAGVKRAFEIFEQKDDESPENHLGSLTPELRAFLASTTGVPYEATLLITRMSSDPPPSWSAAARG